MAGITIASGAGNSGPSWGSVLNPADEERPPTLPYFTITIPCPTLTNPTFPYPPMPSSSPSPYPTLRYTPLPSPPIGPLPSPPSVPPPVPSSPPLPSPSLLLSYPPIPPPFPVLPLRSHPPTPTASSPSVWQGSVVGVGGLLEDGSLAPWSSRGISQHEAPTHHTPPLPPPLQLYQVLRRAS